MLIFDMLYIAHFIPLHIHASLKFTWEHFHGSICINHFMNKMLIIKPGVRQPHDSVRLVS